MKPLRAAAISPAQLLAALAFSLTGAACWAQGAPCSANPDPNDAHCTVRSLPIPVPPTPSPNGAPGGPGSQPGMGQFVCAFVDTKTQRCLTMRPNTQEYDRAVQTGIEAAMMGMQVQADAIQRAGQMGVLGGFGRVPDTSVPGAPGVPSGFLIQRAPSGASADSASCLARQKNLYRENTGRDPTESEVVVLKGVCR